MAKVKVTTGFTGRAYGVNFMNGVSENIENKELLNRLKIKGYEVVQTNNKTITPTENENQVQPEKSIDQMNKGELIDYAKAHGIEIDETATNAAIKETLKKALKGDE